MGLRVLVTACRGLGQIEAAIDEQQGLFLARAVGVPGRK
jgi:hypothetical protein